MIKEGQSLVPLLEREQAPEQIQKIFDIDQERLGKPKNLTRIVANSLAAWQTTSRALQIYLALRRTNKRTRDLLCLYTSLLNDCLYCIDDAAGEALLDGWSPDALRGLAGNLDDTFSFSEVVALHYTETLTRHPTEMSDHLIQQLYACFDAEEILEITTIVSMKNFWNRFASAIRIPAEGHCQDVELLHDLLEIAKTLRTTNQSGKDNE